MLCSRPYQKRCQRMEWILHCYSRLLHYAILDLSAYYCSKATFTVVAAVGSAEVLFTCSSLFVAERITADRQGFSLVRIALAVCLLLADVFLVYKTTQDMGEGCIVLGRGRVRGCSCVNRAMLQGGRPMVCQICCCVGQKALYMNLSNCIECVSVHK